jgi:hypothetical protein
MGWILNVLCNACYVTGLRNTQYLDFGLQICNGATNERYLAKSLG